MFCNVAWHVSHIPNIQAFPLHVSCIPNIQAVPLLISSYSEHWCHDNCRVFGFTVERFLQQFENLPVFLIHGQILSHIWYTCQDIFLRIVTLGAASFSSYSSHSRSLTVGFLRVSLWLHCWRISSAVTNKFSSIWAISWDFLVPHDLCSRVFMTVK